MAAVPTPDPTVLRRRLRIDLRNAREAAGMTQREVAEAMDWSLSKLIRIESGVVTIGTNDLKALLSHYGINDRKRVNELVNSARASRRPSWWDPYRDVASTEYLAFVAYESSASTIRNFEPILIPGLLQTREYAYEAITYSLLPDSKDVNKLVELRLARQKRIDHDEGLKMYFVIDESVIRRVVGNPRLMRDQVNHLMALADRPNIDILIMPFEAGLHLLSRTPMVHFEFPNRDEDVLYIETALGDLIRQAAERPGEADPSMYLERFWTVEHEARKYDPSILIKSALEHLPHG